MIKASEHGRGGESLARIAPGTGGRSPFVPLSPRAMLADSCEEHQPAEDGQPTWFAFRPESLIAAASPHQLVGLSFFESGFGVGGFLPSTAISTHTTASWEIRTSILRFDQSWTLCRRRQLLVPSQQPAAAGGFFGGPRQHPLRVRLEARGALRLGGASATRLPMATMMTPIQIQAHEGVQEDFDNRPRAAVWVLAGGK